MSRHVIEAADGTRHVIEIDDGPVAPKFAPFDVSADIKRRQTDVAKDAGLLENLGAGFDSVWQGAKQLVGKGDSDKDIEERRRLKKLLADNTTGGGLTQLLGEVLGSAPLTMGVGGAVGKGVVKMLPKAAEWAMKGGRVANLGTVGNGAVQGATGGALAETTTDESKGLNTALGGVVGSALPAAVGGVGAVYKALNKSNAPNRAAALIEKSLGKPGVQEVEDALHAPANQSTLPLSTAAKSNNTKLAALERGARSRGDWTYTHDRPVHNQAWKELQAATSNADELPARIADRELMMSSSKKDLGVHNMTGPLDDAHQIVSDAADSIRSSAAGRQIPEISKEVGQVEAMLAHPDRTAEDYATQWFRLSDLIKEGKLGPDGNTALMKLRDAVHDAGDAAGRTSSKGTDTRFSDMLGRYMAEEQHVGSAQASKALRETFVSPEGVVKTAREGLTSPEVTSSALRKSLTSKGEGAYGDLLEPQTRFEVERLVKDLGRHELHSPRNSPGATGLGIENPTTAAMSGRDNVVNYFPGLKGGLNLAFGRSREATTQAADQALMDPQHFQAIMEGLRQTRTPISSPKLGDGLAFKPEDYADLVRRGLLKLPGRVGSAALGED